ncbi:MAG: cysteine--tRNA ligase, partial [Bacteroidia bacterium]|nr:cysteine--tRNA ligase [Bacteroidia bacterium]
VHIMRWPSPWSEGFPGWHLECSAMSQKYLGETFDIHGGGMDLLFPHHECEIAQSVGAYNKKPVKYWMHNNMITINGQKMGRSLGNFITLDEFFSGSHKLLEQAYGAMTIRFFILQAHYRSTVDFSNSALKAAEKGYKKLMNSYDVLQNLKTSDESTVSIQPIIDDCYKAMSDDLNSAMVLAKLFEAVTIVNSINDGKEKINEAEYELLKQLYQTFVFDVLGLKEVESQSNDDVSSLMQLIIELRAIAKDNKDYATSDKIRDELNKMSYQIKDGKDGTSWSKA